MPTNQQEPRQRERERPAPEGTSPVAPGALTSGPQSVGVHLCGLSRMVHGALLRESQPADLSAKRLVRTVCPLRDGRSPRRGGQVQAWECERGFPSKRLHCTR